MTILDMDAKECTGCGDVLPLTLFPRNRSKSDGRGSQCLSCHREAKADYDAGIRYGRARPNANRTGRFLCTCETAWPRPGGNACTRCGLYVVARLHPDARAKAIAKHPWFAGQAVVDHERRAVSA